MIAATALSFAQARINQALETDPLTRSRIVQMSGKSFLIESRLPALGCRVEITEIGLTLARPEPGHPQASVTLSGRGMALAKFALSAKGGDMGDTSEVSISGDAGALLQLSRALSDVDIDWEALLADVIGEIPAHFFANRVRELANQLPQWSDRAQAGARDAAATHLNLPSSDALSQLQQQTRQLGYAIDRLQARLDQAHAKKARSP